jgi:hypothetical protein
MRDWVSLSVATARLLPRAEQPGAFAVGFRRGTNWLATGGSFGQSCRMLVTPRPGTDRRNLRKMLGDVRTAVFNLWNGGGPGTAQDRLAGYLEWVTSTVRQLAGQVSAADLDRLVLTRGYDRLLSAAGTMTGTDMATQRVDAFDAAVKALEERIQRWSRHGVFVTLTPASTSSTRASWRIWISGRCCRSGKTRFTCSCRSSSSMNSTA